MMLAETLSATFIKQISPVQNFPIELGYFRSKIFVSDAFTNPLIAAASPIISLLERINIATQLPEVNHLHENIQHEFLAFYSRLYAQHCSDEFFTIANYLLSATTDELLGKNYLRLSGQIESFKAFTPITIDNIGPEEHFFNILKQLTLEPEQFLDLIELTYYCLMLGFEGKYHRQNNSRIDLDNLIDHLFQLIQKYRINQQHKLFKNYILKTPVATKKNALKTIIVSLLISVACIASLSEMWFKHETSLLLNQQEVVLESML